MKARNCCKKMKMAQDLGMMVVDDPIPEMPYGICMNMDYCPWCGAKIKMAPKEREYTIVTIERYEGRIYAESRLHAERLAKAL